MSEFDDNDDVSFDVRDEEASGGLGLSDFLNKDPDAEKSRGGQAGWLADWKKAKSIVVWLHTKARIWPTFSHQFIFEDVIEDRDTKKEKTILRWPRYISPDPAKVHVNQFFIDRQSGLMRVPPDRDPFLLLREWLRHEVTAGRLAEETVVFEWVDHKRAGELIQWTAGELGLRKRGKQTRGHSLDTKLEYLFVVVQDEKPGDGAVIARAPKLLGDLMREEIKQQCESKGEDQGDPTRYPYAFKWVYDPTANTPMQSYKTYRYDRADCTDEVWAAITSDDPPDPSPYCKTGEADPEKVRSHFEAAQQIDLPLDAIFSEDPATRATVWKGRARASASAPKGQEVRRPPAPAQGASRPGRRVDSGASEWDGPEERDDDGSTRTADAVEKTKTTRTRRVEKVEVEEPAPEQKTIRTRRQKVAKPEPEPEPEPKPAETIPCEDCGRPMALTQTKCECGAVYQITGDGDGQAKEEEPAEEQGPAPEGIAGPVKRPPRKGGGSAALPARGKGAAGPTRPPEPVTDAKHKKCWACGNLRLVRNDDGAVVCADCGQEQGDDVPFDR